MRVLYSSCPQRTAAGMAAWWPRVSILFLLLPVWRILAQPGVTTPLLQQQDSCGGGNLTSPCTCEFWNSTTDDLELEVGCCCTGYHFNEVPNHLDHSELEYMVQRLTIDKAGLVTLTAESFKPYNRTLRDIDIKRAKSLQALPPGIFSVTSGKLNTV
ncbi:hypothetical protein B566_EDAN007677 [Ephemera danica]|nr:hypothetical protein B566_EDAN007677 [Ephemera danica]